MKVFVYILINKRGTLYIGQTNSVERRLVQHNNVLKVSWTSRRGPWVLLYSELFDSRVLAMKEERLLKSLKNKSKVLEHIGCRPGGVKYDS